jgi:hypothetical protein
MNPIHKNPIDCALRRAMFDGAVVEDHPTYAEARKRYWRQQEAISIMLGMPWEQAKTLGL